MSHPMLAALKIDARSILDGTGQSVTYTPSVGDAATIDAQIIEGPDLAGMGLSGLDSAYQYEQARWAIFHVHADDLAARPVKDADTITRADLTWTVRQVQSWLSGAGWKLWCSTDERGGI